MAEYQKFMFDNFVVSGDKEGCSEEPLSIVQAETENMMEETTRSDAEHEEQEAFDADFTVENNIEEYSETDGEFVDQEETADDLTVSAFETEEKIEEVNPETELKYSQEDMDTSIKEAEAKAKEQGYSEGYEAATSENQKIQQSILESIDVKLSELMSDNARLMAAAEASAIKVALEAVRKVLPSLEQDVAKKELVAFLGDNFNNFKHEGSLAFCFHPQMAAEIAPQLSKIAEKHDFEGKISVHKDVDIGLSDCRVEWKNGGVERNTTKVLDKIEELIS